MSALRKDSLVLVSGANGWIASHIIDQLLEHGFRVRGTVRDQGKAGWLKDLMNLRHGGERLEFATVPDIANDGAFDEAIKGVSAFIHVASVTTFSTDPDQVIPITVKGVNTAFSAALKEPNLKSFVFTSSIGGACVLQLDTPRDINVDSYANEAIPLAYKPGPMQPLFVYSASKALAEKEVWKLAAEHNPHFTVNTVVPNRNLGPLLAPGVQNPSSGGAIPALYSKGWDALGIMRNVPSQHFVNVQDTARLHIAPLMDDSIRDERIFAAATEFSWNDVLDVLKKLRPEHPLPGHSQDNRRDLYNIIPAKRAEEILRKTFGRDGFVGLEESVKTNIAHLE